MNARGNRQAPPRAAAARRALFAGSAVLGILCLTGCDNGDRDRGPFPKPILARFQKAGLDVGSFQRVQNPKRYGATECHEGTVSGLAVLLCRYADEKALARSERRRLAFVGGAVTGAQRVDGRVVLVVADRDKKDLRGKRIQRLLQAFKKEKPY